MSVRRKPVYTQQKDHQWEPRARRVREGCPDDRFVGKNEVDDAWWGLFAVPAARPGSVEDLNERKKGSSAQLKQRHEF